MSALNPRADPPKEVPPDDTARPLPGEIPEMPDAPETLLLTRDLELVQLAAFALPESRTDWRQTFTSGLSGLTRGTRVLIVDAEVGAPMAHLLAALFLDQAPDRLAVVVQAEGAPMRANCDPRVQVLERPLTPERLRAALDEAAEFGAECGRIETLARFGEATWRVETPACAGA